MKRHFDQELKELNQNILNLSALAQDAIAKSIEALRDRDKIKALRVIEDDGKMDCLELTIEEQCIDLIARHQPVAGDLRFLAAAIKINAQIERIGDLAVDVCQRTLELADKPLLKPLVDIPKLSQIAQRMVKDSIESFVERDAGLAKAVVMADAEPDELRNKVAHELVVDYLSQDPATADRAVPLLLVARHLERICDHATNIAEDVIYMVKGKVVRHQPEKLNALDGETHRD